MRPLRPPPPPLGSAPENYSLDYSFNLMIYCTVITSLRISPVIFYLIMTSRHILSLPSVMQCRVSRPTDMTDTDYNNFSGLIIRYKLVPPELQVMSNC